MAAGLVHSRGNLPEGSTPGSISFLEPLRPGRTEPGAGNSSGFRQCGSQLRLEAQEGPRIPEDLTRGGWEKPEGGVVCSGLSCRGRNSRVVFTRFWKYLQTVESFVSSSAVNPIWELN